VLADLASAIVLDDPNLIIPDPVDAVFAQEKTGIVDQELRDPLVPVGENLAAGPALIGEVQTMIQIAIRLAIVEPHAVIVEAAAGMIVDEVEDYGDAVQMAQIDEALQLIDPGHKLRRGQGGLPE
jgi:hypothetical protein